jgi:hypothetical protein
VVFELYLAKKVSTLGWWWWHSLADNVTLQRLPAQWAVAKKRAEHV